MKGSSNLQYNNLNVINRITKIHKLVLYSSENMCKPKDACVDCPLELFILNFLYDQKKKKKKNCDLGELPFLTLYPEDFRNVIIFDSISSNLQL